MMTCDKVEADRLREHLAGGEQSFSTDAAPDDHAVQFPRYAKILKMLSDPGFRNAYGEIDRSLFATLRLGDKEESTFAGELALASAVYEAWTTCHHDTFPSAIAFAGRQLRKCVADHVPDALARNAILRCAAALTSDAFMMGVLDRRSSLRRALGQRAAERAREGKERRDSIKAEKRRSDMLAQITVQLKTNPGASEREIVKALIRHDSEKYGGNHLKTTKKDIRAVLDALRTVGRTG